MTKHNHEEIERWRQSGLTWQIISEELGVNKNSLRSAHSRWKSSRNQRQLVDTRFPDYPWPEDLDWRDQLDLWEQINEQVKAFDPYVEFITVNMADQDKPIAVAFAADLHMGGGFTDHQAVKDTLEYILDTPNLFVAIIGDSIEGFLSDGKKPAETIEQMAGSTKAQLHAARTLVEELCSAEKLLLMTWGDHDAKWFEAQIGLNVMKQQVHRIVPYFTGNGIVRLLVGDQEYFLLINHSLPGRSVHNPNYAQRRAYRDNFPADLMVSGHTHKPAFQMFHHYDAMRAAGLNVGGKSWSVQAGTFKTGPDPYTIRTWTRGIMGVPTAVFSSTEHDIDVFESPVKAMQYLNGLKK